MKEDLQTKGTERYTMISSRVLDHELEEPAVGMRCLVTQVCRYIPNTNILSIVLQRHFMPVCQLCLHFVSEYGIDQTHNRDSY